MSLTKKVLTFTLVELIVVIAIIAVLAVSSFLVLTKWIMQSRDARRISDLETMTKALEIGYVGWVQNIYYYPDGWYDTIRDITWAIMWYQWTLGDNILSKTKAFSQDPKVARDPITDEFYWYSISHDRKYFQLKVILEKWDIAWEDKVRLSWTYNWWIVANTGSAWYWFWKVNWLFISWWITTITPDNSYIIATDSQNSSYAYLTHVARIDEIYDRASPNISALNRIINVFSWDGITDTNIAANVVKWAAWWIPAQ